MSSSHLCYDIIFSYKHITKTQLPHILTHSADPRAVWVLIEVDLFDCCKRKRFLPALWVLHALHGIIKQVRYGQTPSGHERGIISSTKRKPNSVQVFPCLLLYSKAAVCHTGIPGAWFEPGLTDLFINCQGWAGRWLTCYLASGGQTVGKSKPTTPFASNLGKAHKYLWAAQTSRLCVSASIWSNDNLS